MKIGKVIWLAASSLMAVAAAVLFLLSSTVRPGRYAEALDIIDQLAQTNHVLNTLVLSVHNNLVPHYDSIVAAVREYEQKFEKLRELLAQSPDVGRISGAINKTAANFADKKSTLDRFKLDRAVLRNSLNYMPEAVQILRRKYRDNPSLEHAIDELEVATLSLSATGETRWKNKREATIATLESLLDTAGPAARKDLGNLRQHSDLIAVRSPSIRGSLFSLLQHPLNAELNSLRNVVNQSFADANQQAERYRASYIGAALVSASALIVCLTVTLRTRARRESEQRFRQVIENSSDLITVVDHSGTIRYQSLSLQRILGFEPSAWTGKKLVSFIDATDRFAFETELRRVSKDAGVSAMGEFRIPDAGGNFHVFEALARVMQGTGRESHVILNSRDVTGRNNTRRDLGRALREVLNASDLRA